MSPLLLAAWLALPASAAPARAYSIEAIRYATVPQFPVASLVMGAPQGEKVALTLNTPPSFHNPKSVLVTALPAVVAWTICTPLRNRG